MSWVSDYKYRWYELLAMNVLKVGRIPKHVAFIMDGNRRFATSANIQKIEGHSKGFEKLAECLRWCLDLGIQEVTTFAFSIENFKRSDEEVTALMDLAKEKFEQLLQESEKLKSNGVRIKIIGNMDLLTPQLQEVMSKAMLITETNDKLFLNIAFAYTSRDEMTNSIKSILEHGSELYDEDISERLLEGCMYLKNSPDLLFRTSGENRISDFLMWQLTTTVLFFSKILWPQLTIWHFYRGIFSYQKAAFNLSNFKEKHQFDQKQIVKSTHFLGDRVQKFLRNVETCHREILFKFSRSKMKPE